MTHHRWALWWLASVLVAVAVLPAAPAAGQGTAAAPASLAVLVTGLTPRAPLDAAERFTLSGTVVNRSDEPVTGLQLGVVVGRVLRSRGELARADELRRVSGSPRAVPTPLATDLPAGASTAFSLDVPVGDLRLNRLGVYPLAVQARGRLADARNRTLLGQAVTFVPWFPDGPPQRTRVAWLWPLVDRPRITPDNLLVDDGLEDELATTADSGRLGRLLSAARAARPVPITYAVDPDLLVTVDGMTRPYAVRTGPDERVERPASAAATSWLAALREAVRDPTTGLLALPYADPDVVALTRPGGELADDVEQLRRLGARVAAELTGGTPDEEVVWPPAGRLSPAALEASLGEAGAVVLDETALEPRSAASARTGSTAVSLASPIAGDVTGLVVEQGLSRLVTAGPQEPGWQGPRLAEQRFLAETAMIAAERPGEARTLLVAPERRGDVVTEVATGALLDTARLPWLCPVALADVAAGTATCPPPTPAPPPTPDPPGPGGAVTPPDPVPVPVPPTAEPSPLEDRGPLQPAEPTDPALSERHLRRVAEVDALAEQFTDDVLLPTTVAATATRARLLRARARTESSAWRDAPRQGAVLLDLYADEVRRLRNQVTLSTSGRVALSSSTGTITVNVSNALDQPVTVGVGLNDPIEARLTSTSTGTREVPASLAVQVPIEVTTRTSGQFVVRATLLDRTGRPFGEPAELVVRSTGYSRAALAVTGLGAAVLLVAVGLRIARRALRRAP